MKNEHFVSQQFWTDHTAEFQEGGQRTRNRFKVSSNEAPLITIVTIVYNDEQFIEQTIQSILNQSYENVEYLVIDGGSTDNTLEIIKKYDDQIDYWISCKDKGIYDAMNRGIILAQGVMIGLINSGDYCAENALEYFAKGYKEEINCYYTDIYIVFDTMQLITKKLSSFDYWKGMPICHQSLFLSTKSYKKVGLYDLNYKLLADYDLFLKLMQHSYSFRYIPEAIVYAREGRSNNSAMIKMAKESLRVAWGKLPLLKFLLFFFNWCWDLFRSGLREFLYKYMGQNITDKIRIIYQNLFFHKNKDS